MIEDSSLSSEESSQIIRKGQNHANNIKENISGIYSTEKKNKKLSGTKTICKNYPTVQKFDIIDTKDSTLHKDGRDYSSQKPTKKFQSTVEYTQVTFFISIHQKDLRHTTCIIFLKIKI